MAGCKNSFILSGEDNQTMLLKIYSIAVLLLDIFLMFVKCMFAIIEQIYELIAPPTEKSVAGEIVLITGTGHGIGRELALQYAMLGAKVVCVDINTAGNDETVKLIKERGCKNVSAYKCDVASRDEVLAVVDKVVKEVGPISVLVNNAGIMPCHPLRDHTHNEILKIFEVNVFAHFWFLEAVLPRMIKNNHGHIVALSSMAGIIGVRNLVPYCSSKFAVRGLMEALAEEVREEGFAPNVKFTCIHPYMVDTGLCKKPRFRFQGLLKMVTPQDAAKQIVTAMRRDKLIVSIPSWYLFLNDIVRVFPIKVGRYIKDFFEVAVEAD